MNTQNINETKTGTEAKMHGLNKNNTYRTISKFVEKVIEEDKKNIYYYLSYFPQILLGMIFLFKAELGITLDFSHIEMLMASGFSEVAAKFFVFVAGVFDLFAGLLIIFYPKRVVLIYSFLWPSLPASFEYVQTGMFPIFLVMLTSLLTATVFYFRFMHYNEIKKKLL